MEMRNLLLFLLALVIYAHAYKITPGFDNYCKKEIPDTCETFTWYGDKYYLGSGFYNIGMYSGYRVQDGCNEVSKYDFNDLNSVDFYILIRISKNELKNNPQIMVKYNYRRKKLCEVFRIN